MKTLCRRKGLVVFIIASVFILLGYGGRAPMMIEKIGDYTAQLFTGDLSFHKFTSNIEELITNNLTYHDALIDLNSLLQRSMGENYIVKDSSPIVKMQNGYLVNEQSLLADQKIDECSEKIEAFYRYARDAGAGFLYVMCPTKGYHGAFPDGIENNIPANCDRFARALTDRGIPSLILQDRMDEAGLREEEAYFITDPHWTPETGLWAMGEICGTLDDLYGFDYSAEYADLSNYEIETYEDWFLGSLGKKTGRYFSELGVDDIDLITPKFETQLTEAQPFKEEMRTGEFLDTVLFMENLEERDFYGKNPYATYSGGDFRLQILTNHLNPNGKRMLVIRDSFACAVTPFLALEASEIYTVDLRNYSYYVGEKLSAYDLIEEYDPDYVLVIYTGVSPADGSGRLDFE